MKTLNLILGRLENQILLTLGRQRLLISDDMDDEGVGYHNKVPKVFSNLDEARNSLDHIWTVIAQNSAKLSLDIDGHCVLPSVMLMMVPLRETLKQWTRAFDSYIRRNPKTIDEDAQITIHSLKIQKILIWIFIDIDYSRALCDETVWDEYKNEYELINAHATFVSDIRSRFSDKPRQKFSLDPGIIYPLCIVATRSRDSVVRRRAISLLESLHSQEGMLPSALVAKLARRCLEMEEEPLGNVVTSSDVPNWARIAGLDINFDLDARVANVKFLRARCSPNVDWMVVNDRICW